MCCVCGDGVCVHLYTYVVLVMVMCVLCVCTVPEGYRGGGRVSDLSTEQGLRTKGPVRHLPTESECWSLL